MVVVALKTHTVNTDLILVVVTHEFQFRGFEMEARSGGSFRIVPEKTEDNSKSEKKIYVIHDLMQSNAYEAALQLEDVEDNVRPFLD